MSPRRRRGASRPAAKSRGRRPAPGRRVPASVRKAGLLLHPTSLPGPFPIGDLGPAAHALLDWLVAAGLSSWQLLPLGPTGYGDSPYFAHSSFAGNPLLISPEALVADGLLKTSDLGTVPDSQRNETDFSRARDFKQRLHRRVRSLNAASLLAGGELLSRTIGTGSGLPSAAAERGAAKSKANRTAGGAFQPPNPAPLGDPLPGESLAQQWNTFVSDSTVRSWLEDWALYAALKESFAGKPWLEWDADLRDRKRAALESARRELAAEIELRKLEQFLFFRQWSALRAAATARGIELIGDLPIYPALDSADVWANRPLFKLGRDGRPTSVAGVPPDYFSETGQLWGNPLYRWERLASDGFAWWVDRVRWQLRLFDRLRLDHFRGFVAYWEVPARATSAARGRWRNGPGVELFRALRRALGALPLVAEDLGEIDEPVHALRRRLGLPGMRVMQFGFAADDSLHAPHRHTADSVVYTGTHDNDTSRGWISAAPSDIKHRALTYLGTSESELPWAMVRTAITSAADLAILPFQDLLGLGSEARMNTPARESGNWTWRVRPEQIPAELPKRLRDLLQAASRAMPAPPGAPAPS